MKFLFCSANCLLDESSGAAISVRTLLELLTVEGVECASVTSSLFDQPRFPSPEGNLAGTHAVLAGDPALPDAWFLKRRGVAHYVLPATVTNRETLAPAEEQLLTERALGAIAHFEPQIVMVYGGGPLEMSVLTHSRQAKVPTVFYLANPSYQSLATFEHVDQVFTDTVATQRLYEQRLSLPSKPIGKFIEPPTAFSEPAKSPYVTFVNPSAEKGVTLFGRILELAALTIPSLKFLVVESRATLEDAEKRTGLPFSKYTNLRRIGLQRDISGVLGITKILLVPSLWHESGGRIAIEACSLGIPSVVSDRGGLPEVMGDAGIIIHPPEPLLKNHWLIPPVSQAMPWVEALRQLATDPTFYAEHQAAAIAQWQRHEPSLRVREIVTVLTELVDRAQSRSPA